MARTCESSYKRFIIKHTIFTILFFLSVPCYCISIIAPAVQSIFMGSKTHGAQLLLLLVIPLIWTGLVLIDALWAVKYCRAVLGLLKGKVLVKSGYITQKQKKFYDVTGVLPKGMKKSAFQHLLRPVHFEIHARDCEGNLQVGDFVHVLYPASRILYTGARAVPAIYVFSDEPKNVYGIPKGKIVLWGVLVFLVTAALSVFYYFFWNRVWTALLAERGIFL